MSSSRKSQSSLGARTGSTEQRKADHIRINLEEDVTFKRVTTGLEKYFFMHRAIPEVDKELRTVNRDGAEDKTSYTVVINQEEQYSIWPADRELPLGWREAGRQGLKDECLAYIEEVWTDMRPLSLRRKMEKMTRQGEEELAHQAEDGSAQPETATPTEPYRDPLVLHLTKGEHPIIASRADHSVERFKDSIDRSYVLIKFTDTQGGTELGVQLDNERTDLSQADFEQGQGTAHLEGNLTLNYVKVRCVADVDLAALEGKGQLEVLEWPAV